MINQKKFQNVLFLVEVSAQTQRLIARKMQEEIQKSGLRDVTVRVVSKSFWLEGVVSSDAERLLAEEIAKAFFPNQLPSLAERTDSVKTAVKSPIKNFISKKYKEKPPDIPKLLKITAQFVELSKNYKKTFGFKWQPLLSNGQGSLTFGRTNQGDVTTRSSNTLVGTISNLFPKLSSAKANGHARVIQSGVLLVQNNKQANIKTSEKIPFSLGSGEFQNAQDAFAKFDLTVKPNILAQEKINLDIGLTISSVNGQPPRTLENSIKNGLDGEI